jgi:hypothetical protein
MAQTNYTPIQLYYSTTAAAAPTAGNLANGELGLNITDGKLFYKDNLGVVQVLATKAGANGDVVGPASSTDNALVRFDSTTGKLVQNSVGILSDTGDLTGLNSITLTTALGVASGGTGVTTSTGSGANVLSTSPTLVTPILGTPTSVTLTNATGLPLTTGVTGTLPVANGGTGSTTTPTNGQLLIGNGTGFSLATITQGSGISVTNSAGGITIASTVTPGTGTVTSVTGTGTVNGITLMGTVTSSGNLTLGGTLSGVSLTTQVTGALPVANGGTGNTAGTVAKLATTNFSIEESGGKLVIKYGATVIASFSSAGALISANNITAYGTP